MSESMQERLMKVLITLVSSIESLNQSVQHLSESVRESDDCLGDEPEGAQYLD